MLQNPAILSMFKYNLIKLIRNSSPISPPPPPPPHRIDDDDDDDDDDDNNNKGSMGMGEVVPW